MDVERQITVRSRKKDWQAGAELRGEIGAVTDHPAHGQRTSSMTIKVVPTTSYTRGSKDSMLGKVGGASRVFAWWPTVGWRAWV